ncbi:hypothetical protein C5N14_06700 [Micromonospora sp. MW-13]|uniref:hypothetical protein n=1 Tax=unclassified Micromonospora TaxID=2617518 RepID=UPI000E44166F|nr:MULTISPECIES: hypothetical protein [unclassified Micromonospora]MCX4473803.1 hypothetical protein [Micromonospora sp. NBC_01655]RGC70099.1 hypothetical protein C5N14_06700 [Micromonospora sp. MW-13]
MSPNHAPPTFRRRRPSTLLLVLSLMLGLAAPTALTTPASARPTPQAADPLCYASGFSQPPDISRPLALTWSHVGSRSNGSYTYRYWMVQELSGSTWYYRNSYVASCSGDSLLSSTEIPTTDGFGTAACTSTADRYPAESEAERFVGQRTSWQRPYLAILTFRYWHQEWFSYATLRWAYGSSYAVRC